MAYSVPKQWVHGDIPVAADMQKYSDGLNHIKNLVVSLEQPVVMANGTYGVVAPGVTVSPTSITTTFVHVLRFLIYKGSGNLLDGAGNTTALSDASNGGTNIADLDEISWLTYGMTYYLTGFTVCMEDWYA